MSSLGEFLLARIAEDEADARTAHRTDPECDLVFHGRVDPEFGWECTCGLPARVLAECEAKRRIIGVYQALAERLHADEPGSVQWHEADAYKTVMKTLAAVYADHPDYRDEWKP